MKNNEIKNPEQENMMLNAQINDDSLEDVSGNGILEDIVKKALEAKEKAEEIFRKIASGSND